MSMFGPKEGSWWVRSEKDPRWNFSGRGYILFTSGPPEEVNKRLEELEKLYGPQPDDLEWGGMKD